MQVSLLLELVPDYSIHLGSSGNVSIINTPILGPTGFRVFGNYINLSNGTLSALEDGANLVLIGYSGIFIVGSTLEASRILLSGP
jgi:hypothetical protein